MGQWVGVMTLATPAPIKAQMTQTVTVSKVGATDAFGKHTYATRGTYACYIDQTTQLVMSDQGQEVTTSMQLYVSSEDIIVSDKVSFLGRTNVDIISVATHRHGDGTVWGQTVFLR